jgi:(p)ppGpp synthase/HD superfamily hydrolase
VALKVSKEDFVWNFIQKKRLKFFKKAYLYAKKCHQGHIRNDGTPYFGHPNEVCYIMLLLGIVDEHLLAIAICHDIVEELSIKNDILLTKEEIAKKLDWEVAEGVYTLSKFQKRESVLQTKARFNKIEETVELVLIKTIDRFVNMRRSMFDVYATERMKRYVFETEMYILPMSERIINSGNHAHEEAFRMIRSAIKGILEGARMYVQVKKYEQK